MSRSLTAMRRYAGIVLALIAALAVIVPTALAQSDTPAQTAPVAPAAADTDGPLLAVTSVSSAPSGAGAGASFELQGTVANSGHEDGGGEIVVNLIGSEQPLVVGRASAEVPAGAALPYSAEVSVPEGIAKGSYSLVACIQRADVAGELGCATAPQRFVVGSADPVRGSAARTEMARIAADDPTCSSGAHTLSKAGDRAYPEMGNGGYTSLHTDVNLVYDANENEFLQGTHVVHTDVATECLTDFSLDFARETPDNEEGPGADLEVEAVTVNGEAAQFEFVQPTFPGDPNGQDDPDPRAHQSGFDTPVSDTNPLPPACTPVSPDPADSGQPCPANKLVITPTAPIQAGDEFEVRIEYAGQPGVYTDGGGEAEGWFAAPESEGPGDEAGGDGSFVSTDPVGTMAWMPLNNHPTVKPTYDFTQKVTAGRTAIGNGDLISTTANPADAQFPAGSTTWRWHSAEPMASYLVQSTVGDYDMSQTFGEDGVVYYHFQSNAIGDERKAENQAILDRQEEFSDFLAEFNGPFPFSSDGAIVGVDETGFEEEMQGRITFTESEVLFEAPTVFEHEMMHQWWGNSVSEAGYSETFLKEGFARFGEYLTNAGRAADAAGGLDTPAGDAAFDASLIAQFNKNYREAGRNKLRWTLPPSDPSAEDLFSGETNDRTAAGYIALRQILGEGNFIAAMRQMQSQFAGGAMAQRQMEAVFRRFMPNRSADCLDRLDTFFVEWFDTAFAEEEADVDPTTKRPHLTGPGLDASVTGETFYDEACRANTAPTTTASVLPDPVDGKVAGSATVVLTATDDGPASSIATEYRVDNGGFQPYAGPIVLSAVGAHKVEYRSTDGEGLVEPTKQVAFEIVAAPAAPVACAKPQLTVAVTKPLRKKKGVVTLRKGKAYRYSGSLTCEVGGKRAPAREGTVVNISTIKAGKATRQPGTAVGPDGKVETLLQLSGKRTVVFGFAADGASAEARIRIATARR